ncbi:MAG: hypothetical protein WBP18_01950 [Paracoccaceae bacterium]
MLRTPVQALEGTFTIQDLEAFDRAAGFLHRAKQRDFHSLGSSSGA